MAKPDFLFCWPLWEAASSVDVMKMLAGQAEKNVAVAVKAIDIPGAVSEWEFEDECYQPDGSVRPVLRSGYSFGSCHSEDLDELRTEYCHLITQLIRRSAFLTIYGLFEHRMRECLTLLREITGYQEKIGMGTIEELHYVLTKVVGASHIQDIDQITVIRNIMAHSNGVAIGFQEIQQRLEKKTPSERRLLRAINRIQKENGGVRVNDFSQVLMDEGFLMYTINDMQRYIECLDDVTRACYLQKKACSDEQALKENNGSLL